jgi:hypothetical protein
MCPLYLPRGIKSHADFLWERCHSIPRQVTNRFFFSAAEPEQRLHGLGAGQHGQVTAAVRELPAARVDDAVDPEQPQVWAPLRAGHQHVHLPQVRPAPGPAAWQGGPGGFSKI